MSTWRERAPEIQALLDTGATNAEIALHYGVSKKSIRNRLGELSAAGLIKMPEQRKRSTPPTDDVDDVQREIEKFGVQREIDGKTLTHKSTRLLVLSETEDKDPDALLRGHNYSPNEWELIGSKSKIWHSYSKKDYVVTLYSSSITVKPRQQGWNMDDLLAVIRSDVEPRHIEIDPTEPTDRMLEVAYYDMHWGNATFADYEESQRETYQLILSKTWSEILFVIGSDLFHVDNFNSTTVKGTQLETTNLPKAWKECMKFYVPLIYAALKQSNGNVAIRYLPGNHDSSVSWTFVQNLMTKYPQVKVDDQVKERKVHVYGFNFIGLSHGDKSRKDLIRIFPAEFPLEWSQTKNREAHIGHLHREEEVRGKDEFGLTIRTLSTANPIDAYHDAEGYVTAHKRFMLFEYSPERLKHIHYV